MSGEGAARLRIRPLLRDIPRVYADHWRLLVPLALVVLLPQAIADATLGDIEIERVHTAADVLKIASVPLAVGINLGGEALYAGIVAAAVVHWRRGERLRDLHGVARSIPYGRLVVIDLLLAIGIAIGLVLLIVPGVLVLTYLAISPALVEINHLTIREAVRKSIELVRGNFWPVFALLASVIVATDSIGTALESPLHGLQGEVAFNLAIEAALEPFQGLTTVLLALALMDLRGEAPRA
jgi:hypothetical protein